MTPSRSRSKVEVKPCPFCGGNHKITFAMGEYWINCVDCDASIAMVNTEAEAIAAWNRRI